MNLSLFIARRIYSGKEVGKQVSKPAVRIAMFGIAIGLAVMIVSVAVVIGFKDEIKSKVIGFGSHIQVSNFDSSLSYETRPVVTNDSVVKVISSIPGIKHVQRFSTKPGMIKTDNAFQGMVLKGVGQEFDPTFFRQHLVEGEVPKFNDSSSSNEVLISKALANKLRLKLGDKIYTYFIQEEVRARRLTIKGIYQTNFSEFDNLFLLTDIHTVNRLNQWEPEQSTGMELQINNYDDLDKVAYSVYKHVDKEVDKYGGVYYVQTVKQLNPAVFAWLSLLDMNVWVILILMVGVAGFTMISGLLIIILERTNMIGILKALGAKNYSIREIFLYFSVFLIGKGMFWGNVVGLLFCFVQSKFQLFKLDPDTYYIDHVPVEFNIWLFLLINAGTFIASVLMLVGPSYLISKIHPAKSIQFE
jgi:ABC-type transport system, involved in lipoprotein release, permease component